jgi:hypothetical protein
MRDCLTFSSIAGSICEFDKLTRGYVGALSLRGSEGQIERIGPVVDNMDEDKGIFQIGSGDSQDPWRSHLED